MQVTAMTVRRGSLPAAPAVATPVVRAAISAAVAVTAIVRAIDTIAADIRAISIVAVVRTIGSAVPSISIRPAVIGAVARTVAHAKADKRTSVRGSRRSDDEC